jgi:CRP/FNR family transcriptional regulator, cyclic AMP receptor protein
MSSSDAAAARLAERLTAIRTKTVEAGPVLPPSPAPAPAAAVLLDSIRMLQKLAPEERRALERKCTPRRFAAGEVMIERFTPGSSVFFLVSGVARVVHNAGEDGEFTIATVPAGNALGEIAAIDGQGRTATIVAEADCVVAELPADEFAALLGSRAEIGFDLLRRWASMIRQLDEKISFLATGSPDQRIYNELVRLAKTSSTGGDRWVILEMPNHREIAMWAQTSREVVIRVLADLVRSGVVERRAKTLYIHDYDALRLLATGAEAPPTPSQAPPPQDQDEI